MNACTFVRACILLLYFWNIFKIVYVKVFMTTYMSRYISWMMLVSIWKENSIFVNMDWTIFLNTIWVFPRYQCGIETLREKCFQELIHYDRNKWRIIYLCIMWVDIPRGNHGDSRGIDQWSWVDIFMGIF